MALKREENPFVFGEVVSETAFVNRTEEVEQLVRDLADGQKVFLLSPRRFGKSSLVSIVFQRLKKQNVRTVMVPVSSYATYTQFLERFADKVLRAAGPWDKVKEWVSRFIGQVKPEAEVDLNTGEIKFSLGRGASSDPTPVAPEVFALPGEVARKGQFRMAVCLDEFQQIDTFNGGKVENALRNAVQVQREVGYVFAGSQPSLMEGMLSPKQPFHKAGPKLFLDKIQPEAWKEFISKQFERRGKSLTNAGLERLLETADLIPYDVQRLAHELWDYAELSGQRALDVGQVDLITRRLVMSQAQYYERQWEQLSLRQRGVLQAMAARGAAALYSQAVREEYRLGPASSVQKALHSLDAQDILDRYQGMYFFLDPLFASWIRANLGA
ncbi:MAG TPA: hypothetical protein VI455_04015 [Terriglobia bacterium]